MDNQAKDIYNINNYTKGNKDIVSLLQILFMQKRAVFIGFTEYQFNIIYRCFEGYIAYSTLTPIVIFPCKHNRCIIHDDNKLIVKMNADIFARMLYKATRHWLSEKDISTDDNDSQPEKTKSPIILTLLGM